MKLKYLLATMAALSFVTLVQEVIAQDERYLRELLTERFYNPEMDKNIRQNNYFHVVSPYYQVDLDGNARNESLVFEKIDGKDLFHIHNYEGDRIFSAAFTPLGTESNLYKINLRDIGSGYRSLLLYYYEGTQNYLEFMGTSRLYVVTFKDLTPGNFVFFKGPLLWSEHKDTVGNYTQRGQHVLVKDFNNDGIKEISVRYEGINRVFHFTGKKWVGYP